MRTTSGSSVPGLTDGVGAVARLADHLEVVGAVDEGGESRADEHLVIGEEHPDGHAELRGMNAET